jgi:hypothetical protein
VGSSKENGFAVLSKPLRESSISSAKHAVIFLSAFPDQSDIARVRHDYFMSDSVSIRLIHGECIPVSSAMRQRGIPPNTSRTAFGVVLSLCSRTIEPASSNTQYQLDRSPRSNPIVSFCSKKFLLCFAATVLTFYIAGLLFICALSTSITWERTPHPVRRPAFSSHLISPIMPIGTVFSLSQAVSSAKEFARLLFFPTTMSLQ